MSRGYRVYLNGYGIVKDIMVLLYYSITCGMHCFAQTLLSLCLPCSSDKHCLLGSAYALDGFLYCFNVLSMSQELNNEESYLPDHQLLNTMIPRSSGIR